MQVGFSWFADIMAAQETTEIKGMLTALMQMPNG
jgi:hypothetical protein